MFRDRSVISACLLAMFALVIAPSPAEAKNQFRFAKVSGQTVLTVRETDTSCVLTVSDSQTRAMVRFSMMPDRSPSAAFFSEKSMIEGDRNELHIRVFGGPTWPVPTPLRFGISDNSGSLKAHISLSPAVSEVIGDLKDSNMIYWGQPYDYYNAKFVSYEKLDMTAALLTFDTCNSDLARNSAKRPDSKWNFDWLIPSKPRQ